ncbi:MAG: hypothetical protein Q9170_005564 [Blastenia crenularia]
MRKYIPDSTNDTGILSVEDYIYRRSGYRSTSRACKFPLPMTSSGAQQTLNDKWYADDALCSEVRQILRTHRMFEYGQVAMHSQTKPGYPGGDVPTHALQITVDAGKDNPQRRLSAARKDIMALLASKVYPDDVAVEIYDHTRYSLSWTLLISPKHPAVSIYSSVKKELLKRIQSAIGADLARLSLVETTYNTNPKKPTVLLKVKPQAAHDWNALSASVKAILDAKSPQKSEN